MLKKWIFYPKYFPNFHSDIDFFWNCLSNININISLCLFFFWHFCPWWWLVGVLAVCGAEIGDVRHYSDAEPACHPTFWKQYCKDFFGNHKEVSKKILRFEIILSWANKKLWLPFTIMSDFALTPIQGLQQLSRTKCFGKATNISEVQEIFWKCNNFFVSWTKKGFPVGVGWTLLCISDRCCAQKLPVVMA